MTLRLVGSVMVSVAVAVPVASVRAVTTASLAPASTVRKSTDWLASARFALSLTKAVIDALEVPSEPSVG